MIRPFCFHLPLVFLGHLGENMGKNMGFFLSIEDKMTDIERIVTKF